MSNRLGSFQTPWLISWPLRVTAGAMSLYMVALIVAEVFDWPGLNTLFAPNGVGLAQSTFIFVYLFNAVLLAIWAGFVNRALGGIAQPRLKANPLLASLWFVIPGACFFMPWPVMRELYMASRKPMEWEGVDAQIVGWWWLTRVISTLSVWWLSAPTWEIRGLFFQLVVAGELLLQVLIVMQMTRCQLATLKSSIADVF